MKIGIDKQKLEKAIFASIDDNWILLNQTAELKRKKKRRKNETQNWNENAKNSGLAKEKTSHNRYYNGFGQLA
ncbi:hypothetical protein [Flavobacterium aestuarii]|uniref:hypothetical protein n=1 Tax=Flavobacterium aestuarii TaxID=3149227 RepID=UPI0032B3CCE1